MPPPETPAAAAPFEQALERLEALVGELESGDLELEAALLAFEEGVKLSRQCSNQLRDAERRIETLVAESGGSLRAAFDPSDAAEDGEGES